MQAGLTRLFRSIPKTGFELEFDSTIPAAAAGAQARPGSLKDGRLGKILIQGPSGNRCGFINQLLHEGPPGHLLQMHLASELGTDSEFRRRGWVAYSEGWAHYAAGLGEELGLELAPGVQAERLNGRLFMAVRAAIETGIHWKGWTRNQAVDFYKSVMPWAPSARIETEVDEAIGSPGQRLAYMLGQRAILDLRTEASKQLGERFDIREFTTKFCEMGSFRWTY